LVEIIKIDPVNPEPEKIAVAAAVINSGGVIGYPTETVYGIGCCVHHEEAVRRIYELKKRVKHKPLSVIIADRNQLCDLVEGISPIAERLMQAFWPAPLTLIFNASLSLGAVLLAHGNTIGIRIPASQICLDLLRQSGTAIVSTSANLSGKPDARTAGQVIESFGAKLDLIIDGGATPRSAPSTVVDTTSLQPKLVRVGAISEDEIKTSFHKLS